MLKIQHESKANNTSENLLIP